MAFNYFLLFCIFISLENLYHCYEPISSGLAYLGSIAVVGLIATYQSTKCKYEECCSKPWIDFNSSTLRHSFENELFGQHLASYVIFKSLQGYLSTENPEKALVMSFHGLTGSGKNHVSNMIAKSLFENGVKSKYFHLYVANKDFPHKSKVSLYKENLQRDVIEYTKLCERNLFVFDEIDKMPPGTLDALKPFIDYHELIDGVDYRKNIFIFLSNTGSKAIEEVALRFWADGKDREEITMKHIEPIINKGAFNEIGGFQYSELLSSELIDAYVPFLPLTKQHVKECIRTELRKQNRDASEKNVNKIADQLVYFPEGAHIFSKSGCKRISNKIYIID